MISIIIKAFTMARNVNLYLPKNGSISQKFLTTIHTYTGIITPVLYSIP